MQKNILITGAPKSGKSTLLGKLINNIPNKIGFVTNEILVESGRAGFEVETHTGHKTVLAHVDFETQHRVSNYFVNIQSLESILPELSNFKDSDLLYLDEIGQMQLFSEKFKSLVLQYLDSQNTCLATLSYVFEDDFIKNIKERNDIIMVEISAENREEKEKFISQLLRKIEKARKYFSEPERFTTGTSKVELKSEHGTRNLILADNKWHCSWDFFKQYRICSHAIATKEFTKS